MKAGSVAPQNLPTMPGSGEECRLLFQEIAQAMDD